MSVPFATLLASIMAISVSVAASEHSPGSAEENPQSEHVEGMLTIDGATLPYFIEGSGIPCVVVTNPIMMSRALSKDLREDIQFIFLSSRENVPSEQLSEVASATLDTYLDDIEALRQKLGYERICVFGHSQYGLLALAYAEKYPQHTYGVIMIGTPPPDGEVKKKMIAEFWEKHASDERKKLYENNQKSMSKHTGRFPHCSWCLESVLKGPAYWYDSSYDASWLLEDVHSNPEVNLYDLLVSYRIPDGQQIMTPVFVALGRYDFVVPPFLWDSKSGSFTNLSIHIFDKSGHWSMVEEQELFNNTLLIWLKSIER